MIRRVLIIAALVFASVAAWAQTLTPAQMTALRAYILAGPMAAQCQGWGDGPGDIAAAYNLPASPAFWVFRTAVPNDELGDAMNGSEVAGLSSLNMQRLQVLAAYSGGAQNMSRADRRAAFDSVFSGAGGTVTRAAMAVVWRRQATRFERIYATGTGATASPGLLVVEGAVSTAIVTQVCQ